MININANIVGRTSGPLFDPDANLFFTAAGITDNTTKIAFNVCFLFLKSTGIWTKILAWYPCYGNGAASHAVNAKSPGTFDITWHGKGTFTKSGFLPNGVDAYGDTGININTSLSLNDCHVSYYSNRNTAGTEIEIGALDGANLFGLEIKTSNVTYNFLNQTAIPNYADTDSRGFYVGNRVSALTELMYKDGILKLTGNSASVAKPNRTIYIGAANNGGVAAFFSTKECIGTTVGSGLTAQNVTDLTTAFQTLNSSLLRNGNTLAQFPSLGVNTTFPTWTSPSSADITDYLSALVNLVNANRSNIDYNTAIGALLSGSDLGTESTFQYGGALYVPSNNSVYGIPSNVNNILKINCADDTYATFGNIGVASSQLFFGGSLASNGKIYCAPYNARAILVIDTSDDSIYFIDTTGVIANYNGNIGWSAEPNYLGFSMGSDGKLYALPYSDTVTGARVVLVVNPANDAVTFMDTTGIVVSQNGTLTDIRMTDGSVPYGANIYGSDSTVSYIMKVVVGGVVSQLGSFGSAANKQSGGCIAPNGKIYYPMYASQGVLVHDPVTDIFYTISIPNKSASGPAVSGITLMPNGLLALNSASGEISLFIDPLDDSVYPQASLYSGFGFMGQALARNGSVYIVPSFAKHPAKITIPGLSVTLNDNFTASRYRNSY